MKSLINLDKEKLKKLIRGEIKIEKKYVIYVIISILILNILMSMIISYIMKDYTYFTFALGEFILLPITILGVYSIKLIISIVNKSLEIYK